MTTETAGTVDTLGDALPREMARVTKLIELYASIGPAGGFAIALMRRDLAAAATALAEGDLVAMIRVYQSLKDYKA